MTSVVSKALGDNLSELEGKASSFNIDGKSLNLPKTTMLKLDGVSKKRKHITHSKGGIVVFPVRFVVVGVD